MNGENFEQLRSSVIEAGQILSGSQRPSREFRFEIVSAPEPPQEMWAVCLVSDDHELLIPRKLYLVKYGETGVWVRDEQGEMTLCDKDDFLPIAFDPEVRELLNEAA